MRPPAGTTWAGKTANTRIHWQTLVFFIDFICKFGAILGLLGAILRPTWRHLDPMLDHVAAMLGVSCQSRFLCDVIDPNLSEVRFAR